MLSLPLQNSPLIVLCKFCRLDGLSGHNSCRYLLWFYLIGLECTVQLSKYRTEVFTDSFFLFCTFELSVLGRLALAQRNCELWWFSAEK